MKLKKLVEAKTKLTEADEFEDRATDQNLSDINPATASEETIAAALQNNVEDATDGNITIPDDAAKRAASEISDTAKAIDADGVAMAPDGIPGMSDDEVLGVENDITRTLDDALRIARKGKRQHQKKNANVLITGLPGSGKTAIVEDWAHSKGIYPRTVETTDPNFKEAVYGLTLRDITKTDVNKTAKAASNFFDDLDENGECILFLDEFNRGEEDLRRAILTLVNEHWIPDPNYPEGHRYFNNLLFSVAAINPGGLRWDRSAGILNDAEKSRFSQHIDFDSNVETTVDYFQKHWDNAIKKLNKNDPYYLEDLEEYLKSQHLGLFIVQNRKFKYDTAADQEELHELSKVMLNQRELTIGINFSEGDVDRFKFWVEKKSKFLQRDIDMLLAILAQYQQPTLEQLIKLKNRALGIDLSPSAASMQQKDTETTKPAVQDDDEEDDASHLFMGNGSKAPTLSQADVELILSDVIDNLNF